MPLSASGYGTTHKIREQLDFTDEVKWKQFSSRRLELIDKFELSKHKASEQDENIKQIANMLRIEFEFPIEATQGFEKLVTAAVQSVRRNRKRSKKKTPGSSSSSTQKKVRKPATPTGSRSQTESVSGRSRSNSTSSSSSSMSSASTNTNTTATTTATSSKTTTGDSQMATRQSQTQISRMNTPTSIASPPSTISLPFHHSVLSPPNNSFQNAVQNILLPLPTSLKKSNLLSGGESQTQQQSQVPQQPSHPKKPVTDEDVAKSIISDMIILPVIHNKAFIELVKNSETCNSIISKNDSLNESKPAPATSATFFATHANIEILGEMAMKFSISFSVENNYSEKFADIASTKEYITLKTFQQESLTNLAKCLFNKFNINANIFKQNDSPFISKLLFIIIGCLVKDHGFNKTLSALNPLLEELTLNQFTNATNQTPAISDSKSAVGLDILSAVSLQIDQESQNVNQPESNQNNLFTQLNNNSIRLPQPQRRADTPSTTLTLPIPTPSSSVPSRSASAITIKPDVSVIDNIISRINQRNSSQEPEDKKRHLFKDGNLPHPIAQSLS